MDFTAYSDSDLARLALSSRLRELSEAFRVAVAADQTDLAARLWSLLAAEVPALQETIVQYVRGSGGTWADVAALGSMSEEQARDRWKALEPPRTPDPAKTATALDEWYVRHAQLEPLAHFQDPFSRLLDAHSPKEHECWICVKYRGEPLPAYGGYTTPPGGTLFNDGMWRVGHGPTPYWPAGTLLIESHRHFLDFAEMTEAEAASIGPLIRRFVGPLKEATGAPRIHAWSCMEGAEHFHLWLVPRVEPTASGRAFIGDPGHCGIEDAEDAVARLRKAMAPAEGNR